MSVICAMQPYLFPYLPYFQLAQAADAFWVLDDVQYIRRGWMNRNRVLQGGAVRTITFPVATGTRADLIHDKHLAQGFETALAKVIQSLARDYAHAPHRDDMLGLVRALSGHDRFLDAGLETLKRGFAALGVTTPLHCASTLGLPGTLRGQNRIFALCRAVGATTYINPAGGRALYDPDAFATQGIALRFLEGALPPYPQIGAPHFVPGLSILDLIAHVAPKARSAIVRAYSIGD